MTIQSFAHNSAQLITSPLYPDQYPGAIECVYRLIAPAGKLINLELIELDLAQDRDYLFIRDGQQSADLLLASLTGTLKQNNDKKFLISSGNKMYIYFRSEYSEYNEQRRGFAIRFRTDCDINYVAQNGTISSPAYQVARYPLNQQCVYRISRQELTALNPSSQAIPLQLSSSSQTSASSSSSSLSVGNQNSLSLRFDDLDLGSDDQLIAYDGHDLQTAQRINPIQPKQTKLTKSSIVTAQSGKLMLVFTSSALPASGDSSQQQQQSSRNKGFSATFSADCPPLKLGKNVLVAQGQLAASVPAKFGQQLTYSCPRGQEFSNGQLKLNNECQLGGKWSMSKVPNCQERYCGPVPQIDNGFAINATGVTFNQTATYKCYNGFNLASGRQTETITCLESGSWGKLPECYSTSCPALRDVAHAQQIVLSGSGQTRSYGTVIRFECEPGYQRVGLPTILCTSSGSWSSQAPECVKIQCRDVPSIENAYLVEINNKSGQQLVNPNQRKFYFQDEVRVQCQRGYKLDISHLQVNLNNQVPITNAGLINGIIKCGANQTFENVPKCIDIDECQIPSTCDSVSTNCKNLPGGYQCECKQGYSANLDCKPSTDLGLTSGQLPDSAIKVSSTAVGFDKNNIRFSKSGWCGASQLPADNYVRIDLQSVTVIRGFRIQPVNLASASGNSNQRGGGVVDSIQAFSSLLRLKYSNNLTDVFKDYQDATKRAVQFRLNNINTAGVFNINLPLPIEARYLELIIVEYQGGPCMKLELIGCIRQSCSDINECLENNGGCSSKCINSPGSYQCACERGHDLFTSNGTHGFFIAPNETGLKDGDIYRLNKTCVPKQCPSLSDPMNGQLLSTQQIFHYGDSIKFKCNFGYVMSTPSPVLSCSSNGQWNGTIPECHQAKCKPLSNDRAQGLVAKFDTNYYNNNNQQIPSTLAPQQSNMESGDILPNDGQLPFLSNMTIHCKEPGRLLRPTASAQFRQCVYNIRNDTGRGDYWFSGTSPACPRVDCGIPPATAGALSYQYSDTRFGSSFFFGCEETYNLAGSSKSGNVVTCKADGSWDFGDLRCEGPVCHDPGRAPDGEQIATSYEPNSKVQFRCKRNGYVPYTTDPLTCTKNADCKIVKPLGLANGLIPDKAINASSYRDNYEPSKVRLGSSTGWCAKITETMPYLTVDLGKAYKIKALILKGVVTVDVVGRPLEVRVFYKKPGQQDVSVVYPNINLTTPIDLLQQQLGLANYGELTVVQLPTAIVAQTIGVNIVRSIRNPCLRLEILGCEDINRDVILGFDNPVPVCVDQEPPQFTSCPEQPILIQRGAYGELLPINFTIPQAFDNSGLVARLEVKPKGFRPGQYVFKDQQVHYVASDNDGNVAICTVNISVPDVTPPRLSCPTSYTHYIDFPPLINSNMPLGGGFNQLETTSQLFDYNQLMRDKIQAFDESGPVYLEIIPSSSTVSVNNYENITVYARDRHNNTAQCNFQVRVKTPTCSQYSLIAPVNGQLECLPRTEPQTGSISGQIFQCVATCNEGYRFLDGRRAHTYECDNSQTLPPQIQDCVPAKAEDSSYNVLATINYKLIWPPSTNPSQMNPETLVDCMSNYTEFVKQYANDLQGILTDRCTVLNGDTNVEFKKIRSYLRQIVRQQQEELVAIQYDMRVDSKVKKGPIFGLCGQTIRQTFDLRLPASSAISSLLNLSLSSAAGSSNPKLVDDNLEANNGASEMFVKFASICPTLIASSSSAVAGYKCSPGQILTNQTIMNRSGDLVADSISLSESESQFGEDRLADMDVPVCLHCPYGTFSAGSEHTTNSKSQCKLCPRGFYQDQMSQAECKQCPEFTYTLIEGSKSVSDCQPICAFGYYSETGQAPCNQCPINTYSASPPILANTGYTECVKCPPHRPFTYAPGSSAASDCRSKCQPGTYSDTGLEPCSPCPLNFYQEREGAIKCDECHPGNRTLKVGASSPDQCSPSSCMPTLNPTTNGPCLPESEEAQSGKCFAGCQQNGVCTIQLHEPQCHCPSGFKGKYCEIEINECSSEPCYNGATCIDLKQGYKCKCPPGYSGLQCQIEQSDCKNDTCPERSMCQDLPGLNNFTCLCRKGYTGPNCNITVNPCDVSPFVAAASAASISLASDSSTLTTTTSPNGGNSSTLLPCENGAQCIPLQQGRYKCICPPGWTGSRCEINVDDCAEEPCLVGAKCTDLINDYQCHCPPGFTGKRCHEKVDQCSGSPCGTNGICVDRLFGFECICAPGWRGERCNQTIDYCASNPCLNNGECVNTINSNDSKLSSLILNRQLPINNNSLVDMSQEHNNFRCICDPRFTGSRCQHDVDSCEIHRCEHGGTCIDTPDGFECKCRPGFVGLNCEAQVKECVSEPCFAQGTLECQDLPNSYKCVCLPGYTGEKCDIDIDECANEPCRNGAQCQDRVNDYYCQCSPGWTGKNCDIDVGKCGQNPCLNNAKCVDLFEDYFCVCPSGTDGKQCQTSPRRCIGDPCQNGGQCHDFGSGLNCTCQGRYSGSGCQHLHDPCSESANTCKNGATCLDLGGHDYQCQCKPGWMGKNCDIDVPDCGPHSCAPNAQCIDLTNKFYCKCPFDMTGEDCRKPINVDYDLNFNELSKSAAAGQAIPFEFGQQVRALTLSVWVQFTTNQANILEPSSTSNLQQMSSSNSAIGTDGKSKKLSGNDQARRGRSNDDQATGVFLTLYSSSSAFKITNKRELIKFDHAGVSISLIPNQTAEFLPYLPNVPINDGQWHYINLIWDSELGNVTLITDSAVAGTKSNYGLNEKLDNYFKYGYINLGAELSMFDNSPADSNNLDQNNYFNINSKLNHNKVIEGSGFYGKLSRVNIWSKALDINSEIPKQFRNCKNAPMISQQLLTHWANFDLIHGNVEREQPGQCGQRVCPIGLTGDECAILQQDKQAPKVLLCPPDMWVITPNVSTSIEWDEPHFIDDLAKPVAVAEQNNLKPGAMFNHGVYDLSYIAVDESGNTARCDFQIRVLRDFCPIPLAPINGRANCKAWGPNGRFRTCSIECNDGFEFSQPVSKYYVCGAEGFWRPTSDPQRELVFPACTLKHSAQRIYRISVNFPSTAVCSESGKRILNSRIHENLLKIDQNWKLCSQSSSAEERGKCEHLRVNVKCTKQLPIVGQSLQSSIIYPSNSSPLNRVKRLALLPTTTNPMMTMTTIQQQQQQQQQDGSRQEDVYTVEVSFPANADPISNANTKLKRNITDILREAIFKESILDVHQTLPNVQPDITSLELNNEYACEPGTVVVGSSCVECAPGTFYDDSTKSCIECPISSYQEENRATQCKLCPSINSKLGVTATTGARSADQCKERCSAGKYYDDFAGLCRPCGYGYYQPIEGSFACVACGPGLTTRSMEPTSKHECRPECEPGQQLSSLGSCEPCPQGYFRPRGRPSCELCPAGYTTETAGSIERRQCNLILCSAGQYLNVTNDRCQECPKGYYQPNQQRDTQCISCPSDTTTDLEGSTHLDNCTNPCFINGQAQMCQANSYCVFSKETQNYTCECKPKYRMDDNEQCVYVCDDYCFNGGSCSANNEQNRPRCDCPSSFYGERCERKSEFIYIASGIGVGLVMILFIILLIWMICVRTSTSSSSSSMSHIAAAAAAAASHPTKQALQSLHAASQLDFATLAAAAAAANNPTSGGGATLPSGGHPNGAFYYGNGYAESIAPSHHSAYAHYYDDDDENGWDMPNFYNETYMKDSLHAANINGQQQQKSKQNIYSNGQQQQQADHLIDPQLLNAQQQQQQQLVNQNGIANKDELYDRLKRHLYTGQKGDTTDSGEDAH